MDEFSELKAIYIQGLREKIENLDIAFKNKDKNTLIELFHKLAGSGKTYGFSNVSEIGFKAEDYIKKSNSIEEVNKYISELREIYVLNLKAS